MRDLGVGAAALTGLERFFYAAIFAGMKRDNGHSAMRLQAERKIAQERIERAEFIVYGDTQPLENAAHAVLVSAAALNYVGELLRRRHRCLQDGFRQAIRLGFVGILE